MTTDTPELATWSTDEVDDVQRVAYYAAALESSIDPMRISAIGTGPFSAHISSAALDRISSIRIVGDAHSLKRGRQELARSGEPHFRLIVNLKSSWHLEQHGSFALRPRDVVLIDSRYGHATELPSSFEVLHLKLSASWVEQWLPNAEHLAGKPIRHDSGWGGALSSFVAQLSPDFAAKSPLPLRLVNDHLGVLLSLASNPISDQTVAAPLSTLAARIRERTTERSPELFLTAAEVARSLDISVRTLHRSLAACGQSFGSLLIDARSTQALRMLESPIFSTENIAEIGRRCGFADASHFTRVIRRRTGRSPLQIQRDCVPGTRNH
ncbi:AraC family transcriptional regulator [Paucibacter sp. R3-3]|uniref:AraC family transcriptional regulator n=1 Tax=Roseateles agri TaxID=3098619 RepID=A0ABU5DRS9_9BURK|nr:AraC family transcriptional regulator [Paucibacter sp. R3-3]MDY0749031.1 AraC family transcriptional regulator [Paucibacter sp. R3-3]